MSLLTPCQRLLLNLGQKISSNSRAYLKKEEAYEELKKYSGKDFGYDYKKWEEWIKENTDELI